MTGLDTKLCAGCGRPTTGMCWTDCGMSLCGAPLCGDCHHVDEQYGWRHEQKEQKPLFIGVDLSSQPDMTAATVVLSPGVLAALPEVQALIRQAVEAQQQRLLAWCDARQADVVGCLELTAQEEATAIGWIDNFRAAIRKRGEG